MNGGTYLTGLITGIGKALQNNQATAVLIKIFFAFTGFSKHHKNQIHFNESKSWAYVCLGGGGGELGDGGWVVGAFYQMYFFPDRWAYNWEGNLYCVGGGGLFSDIFFST